MPTGASHIGSVKSIKQVAKSSEKHKMTPTVLAKNSVVVGVDGMVFVDLDLDGGGSGTHVVLLKAGHTHWDAGMRSEKVYMVVNMVCVPPG